MAGGFPSARELDELGVDERAFFHDLRQREQKPQPSGGETRSGGLPSIVVSEV